MHVCSFMHIFNYWIWLVRLVAVAVFCNLFDFQGCWHFCWHDRIDIYIDVDVEVDIESLTNHLQTVESSPAHIECGAAKNSLPLKQAHNWKTRCIWSRLCADPPILVAALCANSALIFSMTPNATILNSLAYSMVKEREIHIGFSVRHIYVQVSLIFVQNLDIEHHPYLIIKIRRNNMLIKVLYLRYRRVLAIWHPPEPGAQCRQLGTAGWYPWLQLALIDV